MIQWLNFNFSKDKKTLKNDGIILKQGLPLHFIYKALIYCITFKTMSLLIYHITIAHYNAAFQ